MTLTASRRLLPPLCIRASAGSGKTWALSDRYLGLVMAKAPVSSILATTFTRLAAGEIRDRILLRLVEAYEDPAKRKALSAAIGFIEIDEARAAEALRRVVGDLGRSQVRTLDSFFGAVAAAFALDLGLPAAAAILEEEEAIALRREAIERVFERHGADGMIPLLRRMTEGSPRGAQQAVNDVVAKMYELWLEADERAWAYAEAPDVDRAAVERAIDAVEGVELPDESRVRLRREECLAHARERRWESLLENYLMKKVAEGEDRLYRKEASPAAIAALEELLAVARIGFRHQLGERAKAMHELLSSYDGEYASLKRSGGVVTFGDVTRALANGAEPALLEAIWYRIDARIEHLLLDEFQDTSMLQWRALAPLVEEVLSDETRERTFFCVGDGKQSIYGWRKACPEILASVAELPGVETKPLNASRRSTQVIIDVVNRVFGDLSSNGALAQESAAAAAFSRDWEEHEVAAGCDPSGGYAELRVAGGEVEPDGLDEEGEGDELGDGASGDEKERKGDLRRLDEGAHLAARLYGRARSAEIAILTRTNDGVARVLHTLAQAEVPASGRGGSPLVDAPAVEAVLDLLRLADHPGDTISAFNVAAGPLGRVVGLTVEECRPTTGAALARQALAARLRRRLVDEGYAAVIADLAQRVAGDCDARQHQRLLQLVELAARWEPRSRLRTEPFIHLVETRRMEAARTARIQVMTVHQAKGLGFDIVILPELERSLRGKDEAAWRRAPSHAGPGPIDAIVPWLNQTVRGHFPDLEALHDEHISRTVQESLCVLYVAMTRAKRGLYLLIDPKKPKSKLPVTPAGLLRSALAPEAVAAPGALLYSHGDEASLEAGGEAAAPKRFEPRTKIRLPAPSGTVGRGSAPAPSGAGRRLDEVLRLEDGESVDRGRALHALFESVEWLDGAETAAERARADGERAALLARLFPRRDRRWIDDALRDFHRAIERPSVRDLFVRDSLLPVEVRRERRFAMLAKDEAGAGGRVLEGSIDRLEVWRDSGGRAAGARVIDFKTDRIGAPLAAERAESYRHQLETYRAITARIHDLDPERIEMLVAFVEPGVVVKL